MKLRGERMIRRLSRRKGDRAIGLELEILFVVDVLKLPKAMHPQRHDIKSYHELLETGKVDDELHHQ